MKKRFDKKFLCLAVTAAVLTASLAVGSAMAYFTTYATASGGAVVSLGVPPSEPPQEQVVAMTKHIKVDNTGEIDCFARVKILTGASHQAGIEISGQGWTKGEGDYWYYGNVVKAGTVTPDELLVKITGSDSEEDFNVIVIQECTPALYDENGEPYADWNIILDSGENE